MKLKTKDLNCDGSFHLFFIMHFVLPSLSVTFGLILLQVMTPLPSHIPQCKALYDFRMTNDDEEGCLTFNKVKLSVYC